MRAIFFSDLHIHPHGNDWRKVDDAINVLEWVRNEALDRNIDKVFFLGDLFHVRGYLYPSALARAFSTLKSFRDTGIDLYLLVGNHDMPHKYSTQDNSLTTLSEIATVVDKPAVYETDSFNFWMLPYVESQTALLDAIDKLSNENGKGEKDVLLAHLDVKGALFHGNTESAHGVTPDDLKGKFDLVLTGHYHKSQTVGDNILYIGSPLQINWGEAGDEKGLWVFDDGEMEFVRNDFSPKHIYCSPDNIDEHIKGHYISITVDDEQSVTDIREQATVYEPRSVRVKVVPNADHATIEMSSDSRDIGALMKEWVEKMAPENLFDRDRLLKVGIETINQL